MKSAAQCQADFEKALHAMNQAACEADEILAMAPVRFMPGQEPWKDAVGKWHKQRINVLTALDAMAKAEATMQPLLMEV